MRIIHHGGAAGVTGSCHQLMVDAANSILVDCGLFQGDEAGVDAAQHLAVDFDISTVKALLVTHCHIDHVGRIPYLLAAGFDGPIIATRATASLLPLVIEDALKVGVTRNSRLINLCLERLEAQLVEVSYDTWHPIALTCGGVMKAKFRRAGHILGSAYIELSVATRGGDRQRVVFSGDLGAPYTPLLHAPRSPYRADLLVLESTYGDRLHQGRATRMQQLKSVLSRAVADQGIVIIPAFSIGRTQELLYELEQITRMSAPHEALHDIEVIVDSPMAAQFTQYYRRFKSLWDAEAKRRLKAGRHPLQFENLYTVGSHEEHLQTVAYLAKRTKPAIVIAASGMCAGGRVVNYLKRFLPEPTSDVVFVGYQAAGTPGRDIQRYATRPGGYVMLDGERIAINAQVHVMPGYSAHADQTNLVNFVKRIRKRPKEVILVHGELKARQALAEKLKPLVPKGGIK